MPRPRLLPATVLRAGLPGNALALWARRHNRALTHPEKGHEEAIVWLWRQILTAPGLPVSTGSAKAIRRAYAEGYCAKFGSSVAEDYVLGPALADALAPGGTAEGRLRGAATLLDGDIGQLHAGTLYGLLVTAAERAGVTL